MSRSVVFAAALAVAAIAAGAHAEDHSIRLDLKAYDLGKPADATKVYAKVREAARQACEAGPHEVFASDEAERIDLCVRDTVDQAVSRSNSPLLAALNGQTAAKVRLAGR